MEIILAFIPILFTGLMLMGECKKEDLTFDTVIMFLGACLPLYFLTLLLLVLAGA